MSRAKSRKVICTPNRNCGKNHKMPKDLIPIINKLKKLEFVANVNTPGFKPANKPKGINVTGFDDLKNSYILKVYVAGFEQKIYVQIKGGKKEYYEKALKNTFY